MFESLNEQQRAAMEHPTGPLLVLAGAGTGKTRVLAARVAHLVDRGVDPDRILLLTFTKRAAREMLRRAERLLTRTSAGRAWGGTFHGTAHRLLRRHGDSVGLGAGFTILDQGDAQAMFGMLRADLGDVLAERRFPKAETMAAIYSRVVNAQEPLSVTLQQRFPWCVDHKDELAALFGAYAERKRRHNVVDYDDLLLYWRALLQSPAGAAIADSFEHVLVDEYQDTNAVQADILELMCGQGGNLTVVGDDAQAIYGFRAASAGNLVDFVSRFDDPTVVRLEENYRSTSQILATANDVMAQAGDVLPKTLWSRRGDGAMPELVTCRDEAAQAEMVCDKVLERRERGVALRDQAVLFRTGHHSAALELELSRRGVPFVKFGGLRFLETAHIKDVVAILRVLENPTDELAWNRVLMLVPGFGPATVRRVIDALVHEGAPPLGAISVEVPAHSRAAFDALVSGMSAASAADGPSRQIEMMVPFCEIAFERRYDESGSRLADVETLRLIAAEHHTTESFLAEIVLDPPVSTSTKAGPPHLDDDYLVLSTIHSAKGGEWRAVHLIHASDGNIPSDMALGEPGGVDEERRLLYVALTRARDELVVSVPHRYHHRRFGSDAAYSFAPVSRFLEPIGDRFAESYFGAEPEDDGRAVSGAIADPLGSLLDSLFAS